MRVAMVRARKALHAAGLAGKVRKFLNVHDSLEWYVRRDVPPSEVIAVLQPAVIFPVEGWPPMVADWHAGTRMGSLAELEVGPDFGVTVKGAKAETVVPGDDDEDDVDLPAVDVSVVRAVTQKEVPGDLDTAGVDGGVGAGVVELVPAPDAVPPPGAVAASAGEARTVIVTVPQMPSGDVAKRLQLSLARLPGPHTVILRTPAGDITVPGTSGLTPAHQPDVAFILPGAVVTYDAASVDYAAIAAGITA